MINVAADQPLAYEQKDICDTVTDRYQWVGYQGKNPVPIESRVYAEDPYKGFLPSTGLLHKCEIIRALGPREFCIFAEIPGTRNYLCSDLSEF